MKINNRMILIICILVGLNTVDYFTTKIATSMGAIELNPIANVALQNGLFEILKLVTTTLLIVGVYGLYRLEDKWGYYAGYIMIGFYTIVVTNNLVQLFI